MTLLDTNVLLDIATADPIWLEWSENQIRSAANEGPICINPIIYAELAPVFSSAKELDRWLAPEVLKRLPLPYTKVSKVLDFRMTSLRGVSGSASASGAPPRLILAGSAGGSCSGSR